MELYELELSNLIEVKIMRINTKKLNDLKITDPSFQGIKNLLITINKKLNFTQNQAQI